MSLDVTKELSQNFIEYAMAVNSDRSIPDAKSGLKPVARRILFGAYDSGRTSNKPFVKNARIVGDVMGALHPHGDSSIYGALVRLAQPWIMRYPLIDFHGNRGSINGDGPAAMRYTEGRLTKLSEDGMLYGLKKDAVDFMPTYDDSGEEPITLPAIFPNLLCNPNNGIGVALACNWACHNLVEVEQAINDYIAGKEPMLPGPDFPTGGIIINKDDIPAIMRTGHGTVKIRSNYVVKKNIITITEIPYGTTVETLLNEIDTYCDENPTVGIKDIKDQTDTKGVKIVIECEVAANPESIMQKLFAKTNLQSSFAYNQVALIDKVPTEMNLKDCCEIYVNHNIECIIREAQFDLQKAQSRMHIVEGLIKALEDIDNIIALIKKSDSSATAKVALIEKYKFSEEQAKAILAMRLSSLAHLEKIELEKECAELKDNIIYLISLIQTPDLQKLKLQIKLHEIVVKYGDARRTQLTQINSAKTKEEKEIEFVEDIPMMVLAYKNGIKTIPVASYKVQRKGTKGVKSENELLINSFKSSTQDRIYLFSNKGKMYGLLCDKIPAGNNTSTPTNYTDLIKLGEDEFIIAVSSLRRVAEKDTPPYIFFITQKGYIKKSSLKDLDTNRSTGTKVINLEDNDTIVKVIFMAEEQLILITKNGMSIRFETKDIACIGKTAKGVMGIKLKPNDEVIAALPVHKTTDTIALITAQGIGKKVELKEFLVQGRNGVGTICYKDNELAGALMIDDNDNILLSGITSLVISAREIPLLSKTATGNILSKNKVNQIAKI